jgi:hypothetical protein
LTAGHRRHLGQRPFHVHVGLEEDLVGILTIAIGVGPRTMPDALYHIAIVVVLVSGLVVAMRAPFNEARRRA